MNASGPLLWRGKNAFSTKGLVKATIWLDPTIHEWATNGCAARGVAMSIFVRSCMKLTRDAMIKDPRIKVDRGPQVQNNWTEDAIRGLRVLWDEGHSAAEIRRRLNVSKNSIIGKAHRLELPARPSPLRDPGAPVRARVPRKTPPPRVIRAVLTCCWLMDFPDGQPNRFCDQPTVDGLPYCVSHRPASHLPPAEVHGQFIRPMLPRQWNGSIVPCRRR